MNFEIQMHARALADLDGIHEKLGAYSDDLAERTRDEIKRQILTLRTFPRRCPQARESARSTIELRQLLAKNYRVIFSIYANTVQFSRIVHTSQDTLNPADFL